MQRTEVNKMIQDAEHEKQKHIDTANEIIHAVLEKYDQQVSKGSSENNIFADDEKESMSVIRDLSKDGDWYKSHDAVWRIFLELQCCITLKKLKRFNNMNLRRLQMKIDPATNGDIRTIYERRYLDTPWMNYDGDVLICNPFDFITQDEIPMCPSLITRNTLDNNTPFYTVIDQNDTSPILGSVITDTNNIGVVLAKEIWAIPSANDALRRKDISSYTFLKQFHGQIRFVVTEKQGKYFLQIEGKGNRCFVSNRIENEETN